MNHSKRARTTPILLTLAILLLGGAAAAEAQQCTPNLAYVDLIAGGGEVLSNPNFMIIEDGTVPGGEDCDPDTWRAAVLKITLPEPCSCGIVWVEYVGEPHGWTVNIGDSPTNDGFGGDGGSAPAGQNAEVDVLDQLLSVWSAADNPNDVDLLLRQHLGLRDGALKFVVCDQYVSVGQPFSNLNTPDLERLFFLEDDPGSPDNRTIYVGLNRTVNRATRNGCGARRALAIFQ